MHPIALLLALASAQSHEATHGVPVIDYRAGVITYQDGKMKYFDGGGEVESEALPTDDVIEALPTDDVIEAFPTDDLIGALPTDDVIEALPTDDLDDLPTDEVVVTEVTPEIEVGVETLPTSVPTPYQP